MKALNACRIPGASSALLFGSIKGRILILFAVTFLSIVALAALNFWNLSTVKTRLLLGERYDDLLNNILEVRRYEKNFLFYNDPKSLDESRIYLERLDRLVADLAPDLAEVVGVRDFNRFRETLRRYEAQIAGFAPEGRAGSESLRALGKSLLDAADGFLKTKRYRIHRTILRTSVLPFTFLFILLLLMILVIKLISHGLLKPLDTVMSTTERVARGDFSPMNVETGHLQEIACLIDAFNRMARELETNQEDLLQARKIAAIGTFTAGIAHELNNPINNIALTAESFFEDYAERVDAEGKEMLRDILAQTERAADIVKNLLDFSRTESPVFSRLEPGEVLTRTLKLVKNQIKLAGLTLETVVGKNLPPIRGNLRNLQQVFMNLLLNAIQATPAGGLVRVGVEQCSDQWVRFEVRDSGPGIPAQIRQNIFEPFFSTKEVGKGTGLGLAVSYALVKRHEGRIEVSNGEEGRGAVFTVFLPVYEPDKDQQAQTEVRA